MSTKQPQRQKYLSIDKQRDIASELYKLAETEPFRETILFKHSIYLSLVPTLALYFMAWRAGFRGYGLSKYGRVRLLTLSSGLIFPANGALAHETLAQNCITEPFRPENPWAHGFRFALVHQVGVIPSIIGSLGLTFIFATRTGVLPIPDGMHKKGIREIAARVFFSRIKPYSKSLAITAVGSTAFMFFVGVGSYLESCKLLAKLGRKTLILDED